MTRPKRILPLVGVVLLLLPACSRVERENVDGVDCVVVKSPIGQPRHVDCDWPSEKSETQPAERPDLPEDPQ